MNSSITAVNLLSAATDLNYFSSILPQGAPQISLLSYDDNFAANILGDNVTAQKIADMPWQAFHEGGVYQRSTNSMYVSSNWNGSLDNPINITVVDMDTFEVTKSYHVPGLYEANGGTTWYPPDSDASGTPPAMLWCDEGDFTHASGLVSVDVSENQSAAVLNNYLGRNFSSVNDVRQHPVTGDLWFTDADYGFFQYFRPTPTIPKGVYRFEPRTGVLQVVADGFDQSNGLEFSPDLKTLYVSDTGAQHFGPNQTRPATIYAFDVTDDMKRLENRRTFAYPDSGFPDGIHTDTAGTCSTRWEVGAEIMGKLTRRKQEMSTPGVETACTCGTRGGSCRARSTWARRRTTLRSTPVACWCLATTGCGRSAVSGRSDGRSARTLACATMARSGRTREARAGVLQ